MALLGRISKCLDPSSNLTTDVRFLFKGEGGIVKEVKAHKLILGIASDIFEREFFGPMSMKKDEEDFEIDHVSEEVIRVMIEYIYNKKIEWIDYDLNFLSSLYYLADLYDIEELRLKVIASIPEYEVSEQNVLDVAILAEKNVLHQPLSETLYDTAAVFMKDHFDGKIDNVFDFCSETEASEVHALALFKMMARMKTLPNPTQKCENCEQTICLNGQELTRDNFVPGAQVTLGNGGIWTSVIWLNEGQGDRGKFKYKNLNQASFPLNVFKYKCN